MNPVLNPQQNQKMAIKKIIHISDLHIRAGDSQASRFNEYISQIDRLIKVIHKNYPPESTLVVVTGDLFHDKAKIGPSGQIIAQNFFRGLMDYETVVIRGNHDYCQHTPDEPDLIKPFFASLPENIRYYDETGLYQVEDVEIGIVAVQDTLLRGSTGGISTELPEFPEPTPRGTDPSVNFSIACFHGSFGGALLQNGTNVEVRSNYSLDWIPKAYDSCLFGDIHVQQVSRGTALKNSAQEEIDSQATKTHYITGQYGLDPKKSPWGYAGSLIQQNFGESLWGHGFVEWDIEHKVITTYHVPNDYGIITVNLDGHGQPIIRVRTGKTRRYYSIAEIVKLGWFPNQVSLRFTMKSREVTQNIQTLFEEAGVVVKDTSYIDENIVEDASTAVVNIDTKTTIVQDLSELNSPQEWKKYLIGDAKLPEGDWTKWIEHPDLLVIPSEGFAGLSLTRIQDRNTKFTKSVEQYNAKRDVKRSVHYLKLNYLSFSNILCFGLDNWINFETHTNEICLINGKNGSGKSSLIEAICIAIFGESLPSRFNKTNSASIINQSRKPHEACNTRIQLTVNKQKYWITRNFEFAQNDDQKLQQRNCQLIHADTGEVIAQQATALTAWIKENIGDYSNFLLTTIMSQSNDSDFFGLPAKEQKAIIDSLLQLNVCDAFKSLLKEASINHEYALNQITTIEEEKRNTTTLLTSMSDSESAATTTQIGQISEELKSLKPKLTTLKAAFSSIAENIFNQKPLTAYEKERVQLDHTNETVGVYAELKSQRSQVRNRLAVLQHKKVPDLEDDLELPENTPELQDLATQTQTFETELTGLELERASATHGRTIKLYDSKTHKAWMVRRDAWLSTKTITTESSEPITVLEKQLRTAQTNLKMFEDFDENENVRVSTKILDGLEKADRKLEKEIAEITASSLHLTREIKSINQTLTQDVKTRISTYTTALQTLTKIFPSDHEQNMNQASTLHQQLQQLTKDLAHKSSELKELGAVEYNEKCAQCKVNPYRHKKEKLLAEQKDIEAQQAATTTELSKLLRDKSYAAVKESYDAWRALYTPQLLSHMESQTRLAKLQKELAISTQDVQDLQEQRDENGYETQKLVNEYWDLKDQLSTLEQQLTDVRYREEEELWAQSKTVAGLDKKINTTRSGFINAYHTEQAILQESLETLDTNIANHELAAKVATRREELEKICTAYPAWLEHTVLDEKVRKQQQKYDSLVAQVEQANKHRQKLEEAQTLAQRTSEFRMILDSRNRLLKQIESAFDKYTDWVYPKRVGPSIELAVNGVLQCIPLHRPIKLVAEWENGHFSWYVEDGSFRPHYEKCSGAQKFFISLALRFAFGRMGAANMINSQMFMDEGFTACDAETMDRVPALLKNLINDMDHLETLYIVSHLDSLKSAASSSIQITRGPDSSHLQVGERIQLPKVKASTKHTEVVDSTEDGGLVMDGPTVPAKRRGRPKKSG